jgi:hypothetical protein
MVCWWVLVHCGPQNSALTISLGKKNGDDNGDKQFWKEKFHAANGKAQHALMNGPVFFSNF